MNKIFLFSLSFLYSLLSVYIQVEASSTNTFSKYKTISATSCDSLIKANSKNPNFVILDVRTPSVWAADHLNGSINRNYYDAGFETQLNALPKNKIYLLHCQSGGRSGPTLAKMKSMNFAEVYEMSGGINMWKAVALPTTSVVAPKLMLVSNDPKKGITMHYGWADTLQFTVTNRANDTLKFSSITLPSGTEFTSNFDLKRKLKGSDDYTFSVFYKPLQQSKDSLKIGIKSSGGDLTLGIYVNAKATGLSPVSEQHPVEVYPNPSFGFISFTGASATTFEKVSIFNSEGSLVLQKVAFPSSSQLNLSGLSNGLYMVRIESDSRVLVKKLINNKP